MIPSPLHNPPSIDVDAAVRRPEVVRPTTPALCDARHGPDCIYGDACPLRCDHPAGHAGKHHFAVHLD